MIIADARNSNADWIKSMSWDIYPHTADAFLIAIGANNESTENKIAKIKNFMALPASKQMPIIVKNQLIEMKLLAS